VKLRRRYDHDNNSLNTPLSASYGFENHTGLCRRHHHGRPDVQLRRPCGRGCTATAATAAAAAAAAAS
jgi:hypothetical protein